MQIATPETLLAMKLHAAQRRGNREAADLTVLLPTCGITSEVEAEQLYESYYPATPSPPGPRNWVIQHTGRVTRGDEVDEGDDTVATVHDFRDAEVPMLERMHQRRRRVMVKEGFTFV